MARPVNPERKNLVSYGTKIPAELKLTLDTLSTVLGKGMGQREIIAEMLELYRTAHPDIMQRVDAIVTAMQGAPTDDSN